MAKRSDARCEDRHDGHRCKWKAGHEGKHRAFGKEW